MNHYEAKQDAKKERFEELAQKARRESAQAMNTAHDQAQMIPFGQPILIGHHSEGRDRNFREKIRKGFDKASELQDKASYYAGRAAGVGTAGISSDNPAAVVELQAKIDKAEANQVKMREANKLVRKNDRDGLLALGFSERVMLNLFEPDFCGRVGFPDYMLTNNSANLRRMKERVKSLYVRDTREDKEEETAVYTYREDPTDKRVLFEFSGKPPEEIRTLLKRHAFKWSPTRGAWVRMLNNAGLWAGKMVREQLDKGPTP